MSTIKDKTYVYVVVDISKDGDDCNDMYSGVFSTRTAAEKSLEGWDRFDRKYFEILEELLGE